MSREEQAYRRLVTKEFRPDAIVDVGAFHGDWSKLARRVFGPVPTLMVEAQEGKRPKLEEACRGEKDLAFAVAVLGAQPDKEVTFFEMETGSSLYPESSDVPRREVTVRTRTLDDVAGDLPGEKLFLKLDVQGAELEILAGGPKTLSRAGLVQLECALMPYNVGAPEIGDVLAAMKGYGFMPIDIAGEIRIQGYLVQIDMLFVPEDSELRPKFFRFGAS